jgi:vacuolar-type H+-ATPase subunit E/Vma4
MRKIKSQVKAPKTTRTAKITFALNANLCQQAENWLNSQWSQYDYTYKSLSELIRKSLTAYQEGKININPNERDKHAPKREITIRFFNTDLLNFYYSLPYSQRTAIIEESLREYLDKIQD